MRFHLYCLILKSIIVLITTLHLLSTFSSIVYLGTNIYFSLVCLFVTL